MKRIKAVMTKITSAFITFSMVLSLFAGVGITTMAAATDDNFVKIVDAATLDGWKHFFGSTVPSTVNAGGVWTDKSVFTDGSAFQNLVDADGRPIASPTVDKDGFLVALSAIASNKSIVGYSHIPTDTVLVLDISGSMGPSTWGSSNNDAVEELVLAANAAMTSLLELNNNNRVGIVLYSAEYSEGNDFNYYTLLPIDRYTATGTVTYNGGTRWDTSDDITVSKFLETNSNANEVSIASGVKNGKKNDVRTVDIDVVGGTFIQGGLKAATDLFKARADANDTEIKGNGFQSGTQRKPVMVLMSDGAPTYSTADYTNPTDYTIGNGSNATEVNAFLTQLTAADSKQKITSYYDGSEALFYTLGLGVGGNRIAESVLNPTDSTSTIAGYGADYLAASNNATVEITDSVSVTKTDRITALDYVTQGNYFEADTSADLFNAFDSIVQEIIIQSLYRPTLIEENNAHMEGYIEFIDDIGDFMKIEKIDGILIGNQFFTGEKLSRNFREGGGELGTVANPNELGDNLIWAVKERLGIEDTAVAQQLVTLAYEHGQLSYTDENNWSNYIGWYANNEGEFLGFWDESHTYSQIPAGATYANKSYGMLGEIKDGLNISDLMYVSIQVHTAITPQSEFNSASTDTIIPGHAQLIFRVPASLIPVVTYNVELEGTGYDDASNITMEIDDAEPIRLLFEIGLRNDINKYNITEALNTPELNAKYRRDGKYYFYTNEWSVEQFDKNNADYVNPKDSINTVAYFEPNLQNERYYYTEPTPVYVKNGEDYIKYTSDTDPNNASGEYYRQINIFELTGIGKSARHNKLYERISSEALKNVRRDTTSGVWNIMKDTIHRVYDEVETPKLASGNIPANATGTLTYSYYPTVEYIDGVHYYADAVLGNNGQLTVIPETGIRVTKNVDATLLGSVDDYEFEVSLPGQAGNEFSIVYKDLDGNYIENSATLDHLLEIDANEKGTFTLKAGWTAYIIGLADGQSYTVDEIIPNGAKFKVANNPVKTGTVNEFEFSKVDFVNALREDGSVVISKRITHPFTTAPASIYEKTFSFNAVLSNASNDTYTGTVKAYHSTSPDTEETLTVVNNEIQGITLKANESIVLTIAEGWSIKVTETNIPAGFTLDEDASNIPTSPQTITTTANVVYEFVNDYAYKSVNPDITISASKEFTGRPWTDNDVFTFELREYDPHAAMYIPLASESVRGDNQSTELGFGSLITQRLRLEQYDSVGTHHYSIAEVVPTDKYGITYDSLSRDFNVIVTDDDTDGKLEYKVVNANRTDVTRNDATGAYTVTADKFKNSYKADGIAEIVFEITKNVETADNSNYSPEGFEFGVYEVENGAVGNLVGNLNTTDKNGIAHFVFAYNADDVTYGNNKVIKYVIRETDTQIPGMTYAVDIPVTVTVKDNLDGTISATADIGPTNVDGVVTVNVINRYNPDDTIADFTIGIKKTVENKGTASIGPENFEFSLDDGNEKLFVKTDKDGKAQFTLEYSEDDIGNTYNYILSEVKGDLTDVEYSEEKYEIAVTVSLNGNNKVVLDVELDGEDYNGEDIVAEFTNVYKGNIPVEPTPEPAPKPTPTPEPTPAPEPEPTPTTSPQTGYGFNMTLLAGLLFVSGGLVIYATVNLSKKEEE